VDTHHDGTCQWVLNIPEYKRWYNTASTTLYIVGNPGVGKTVLSKFLLGALEQAEKSKERTIYFFCNRRNKSHTTAVSILRSLIHQCVMLTRSIWGTHVKPKYDGYGENLCESFGNLRDIFAAIMSDSQSGDWYCVLDALDDCDENERKRLLDNISEGFPVDSETRSAKGHQMNLRLLITSRPCKGIMSKIRSLNATTIHFTDAQGKGINECDIVKYVEERVASLAGYSIHRKKTIKEAIITKSGGIFKWASCMINALDGRAFDNEHHTLNLPLPEMAIMFEELESGVGPELEVFLEWVTAAYRPLSVGELGIAVKIKTGGLPTLWGTPDVEATHDSMLLCGGALKVQNDKVYLVHSTMKEFINSNRLKGKPSEVHFKIAKACLIYLSSDSLKRGPLEGTRKSHCYEHYKKLLEELPFLEYAASFWYRHLQDANPTVSQVWNLVRDSLVTKSKRELSFQVHQFSNRDEYVGGQSCLHILAHHNLTFLAKQCLHTEGTDPNAVDGKGRTALWWAVEKNHEPMVNLLLSAKNINPNLKDNDDGMSPFLVAVKNGHVSMVGIFLRDTRISWCSKDNDGRTPLSWAAGSGLEDVVGLLLTNNDVRVAIDSRDNTSHQTPLLWAARKGHAKVVELLLGGAASPNASDLLDDRSALSWAAGNGHEETTALLLEQENTDLYLTDNQGWTAFHWAATRGYKTTARAILNELHKRSGFNWIRDSVELLMQAATRGQDAVLEILLERQDINADSQDDSSRTALSWAANRGHDEIVRQLLATARVNVNSKDARHRTPLMWAAREGREGVVKLLLAEDKIDLDVTDLLFRRTAFGWADFGGYAKITALIRDKQGEGSSR
jgi:ankyrin repeat protein